MVRWWGAAVLVSLAGCAGDSSFQTIDNDRLVALLAQGVPLYDIRLPEEWQQTGVIQGSRLLTFFDKKGGLQPDFVPRFTAEVDRQAPVILICRTGNRTTAAGRYVSQQLGYTQVYHVGSGISRWIAEHRPIVPVNKAQ